ncbi:hypothetical protein LIER_05544 [Lithospermum erythrorhizon]|uniref:GAG-pre-integrase domain-containing protein n=1 Tax=Lithospermum erythrorhizon TaxID=34254 RepID=A0AAV3P5P5_LITER
MCYVLTLTDDDSKNKMVKKRKLATFFAFIVETEPQVADSLDDNNENEDVMTEEELLKDYKLFKDGCIVNNICDQIIMKGVRSADKCYMWTPIKALLSKKSEDANLWHKKLGHTNFKNIQELIVATSDDDR